MDALGTSSKSLWCIGAIFYVLKMCMVCILCTKRRASLYAILVQFGQVFGGVKLGAGVNRATNLTVIINELGLCCAYVIHVTMLEIDMFMR